MKPVFNIGIALLLNLLFTLAFAADKYQNFDELKASEMVDRDYRIELIGRHSPIFVFAIHGGGIEPGTTELVREIAKNKWTTYLFEGLKKEDNRSLHITSTHFDEPQALQTAQNAQLCVSIHGFWENSDSIIVGGGNKLLRDAVAAQLTQDQVGTVIPVSHGTIAGVSPNNIVNKCQNAGVQVELSTNIRNQIQSDPKFKKKVADSIRKSVGVFMKNLRKP